MHQPPEISVAAQVRERAVALVRAHASRLGMDAYAADVLVKAISAISIATDGVDWIATNGRKPELPSSVFVYVRYAGETRSEAMADTFGQQIDNVANWGETVEYRRKRARS